MNVLSAESSSGSLVLKTSEVNIYVNESSSLLESGDVPSILAKPFAYRLSAIAENTNKRITGDNVSSPILGLQTAVPVALDDLIFPLNCLIV